MGVVECAVPSGSALGKVVIDRANFCDAYQGSMDHPDLGVVDIFHGIFGHRPNWMNALLIARNKAAALAGLETPSNAEILNVERRHHYAVGEKIGPWPIFYLGPDELIVGRNNKHMDFRLSIMKVRENGKPSVIVSTICTVNNMFGSLYLSSIIPFHKFGVRKLIANAVVARRF